VILLFEPHRARWRPGLTADTPVRLGESMGVIQ
jgi:hypothetical protein